jgi:hypothetical protein
MAVDGKTTLELERYLAGELSDAQVASLRARVGDETLRTFRAEHVRESELLFRELPPGRFRAQVNERAHAPQKSRSRILLFAPVLAMFALFFVLRAPERAELGEPGVEETRAKGLTPTLMLYLKRGSSVEELKPGAQVSAGDMLQVGYVAAGRRYGAILSLDGAGTVTVHAPGPTLEPQGKQVLDQAYVLDAAPRFERFVLVTSEQPFELKAVVNALEHLPPTGGATEPLTLARGLAQSSFVLKKEEP